MIVSKTNELDLSQSQEQIGRLAKNFKSEKDLGDLTQQLLDPCVNLSMILPGAAQATAAMAHPPSG